MDDLIYRFKIGLKSLLRQGLSGSEFCGGLVYKLRWVLTLIIFQTQYKFISISAKHSAFGYIQYTAIWHTSSQSVISNHKNVQLQRQTSPLHPGPIHIGMSYACICIGLGWVELRCIRRFCNYPHRVTVS